MITTEAKSGDAVWMLIDNEVVPGRLIEVRPDPDGPHAKSPSALFVLVSYSDQSRCNCPRLNIAEDVYPDREYPAARAAAAQWGKSFNRSPHHGIIAAI